MALQKKNCQEATYYPLGSVPDGFTTEKFVGAIYVFYRDGDLDAWYTDAMLIYMQKLGIGAILNRVS